MKRNAFWTRAVAALWRTGWPVARHRRPSPATPAYSANTCSAASPQKAEPPCRAASTTSTTAASLAGIWASNTALFGGSELDVYAGYPASLQRNRIAGRVRAVLRAAGGSGKPAVRPRHQEPRHRRIRHHAVRRAGQGAVLLLPPDFVATRKPSFLLLGGLHLPGHPPTVAITAQAGYTPWRRCRAGHSGTCTSTTACLSPRRS